MYENIGIVVGVILLGVVSYRIGYKEGFKDGATKAFDESLKATEEMLKAKGIIK